VKIVHLNAYDISGGAARAAYRLHKSLLHLGHDSTMFVASSDSDDPTVRSFAPPTDLASRLHRRIREEWLSRNFARQRASRPDGYERFSDDRTVTDGTLAAQLPPCDIINLHWIAGFIDYQQFFAAATAARPVVWTLHDMNAFTGGCHYDLGCGKYMNQCGACPQLGSSEPKDLAYDIWRRKRKVFDTISTNRLHMITPSRWLAREVRRSTLASQFSVSVIPNGVDIHSFVPRARATARDVFGIRKNAKVVLFVADAISVRRKGFVYLAQALNNLRDVRDVTLLCLGRGATPVEVQIPCVDVGSLANDRLLSFAYSAADLFVIPSLQDNLPNTVLEALACGTPVVGFNVGGIPDMVRPGITGLLSPAADGAALREAIVELLYAPSRRAQMAAACRQVAVEEYALEIQARRYVELYEKILKQASQDLLPAQKSGRTRVPQTDTHADVLAAAKWVTRLFRPQKLPQSKPSH